MNSSKNIFVHAATWGAMLFICAAIASELSMLVMNNVSSMIMMGLVGIVMGIVMLVLFFVIIILAQRSWRKLQGGFISYGKAVGYGALLLAASSALSFIYNLVGLLTYRRQDLQNMMMKMQNWMEAMNLPQDRIESGLHSMHYQLDHPALSSFRSFATGLIVGMIGVLITSAFIKKEQPPFPVEEPSQPVS